MAKTDQEMGQDLWPGLVPEPKTGEQERTERPAPLQGPAADEALGAALYPPKSGRFPRIEEGNRVNDCIRDRAGRIIAEANSGSLSKLLQAKATQLDHADLSDSSIDAVEIRDAALQEADFHGTTFAPGAAIRDADLRGANFEGATLKGVSLRGSDIRQIEVDADTNIEGCDFSGCRLDAETVKSLSRCRGFDKAKGLYIPNRFPAEQ